LERFATEHGLKIGTIAALIEYRSRHETLIETQASRSLATRHGAFEATLFSDRTGAQHLALRLGQWQADEAVLVRVHEPLSVMDLLESGSGGHSWGVDEALAAIAQAGAGVAVLLNVGGETAGLLSRFRCEQASGPRPNMDLRTYGVGAQILRQLGVHRMKLLGSPRRMPSMTGFGLEVTSFVPLRAAEELNLAGR
jgi:3,4-dihydroxy 2-butanone 4-phosphate synthase / GTP cyclohydrolase II